MANGLLDNIRGGWTLDWARGNALDVMGEGGAIPLNKFPFSHVIGQTASISGKFAGGLAKAFGSDIGNRMDYDDSSAQDFAAGDNDFTVMAWVRSNNNFNNPYLAKWPADGTNECWLLWNRASIFEVHRFSISSDGTAETTVDIANPDATGGGAYQLVIGGYDSVTEEAWISVDASAKVRVAHTGGAFTGGNSRLGLGWFGLISGEHDQDECAYWNRQLSDADIATIYAGGAGLRMALWDATTPVEDGSNIKQDLVSYWDHTDPSGGDRIDVHAGINNMSEVGVGAPIDQGTGILGVEKSIAHADMTSNSGSPEFLEKSSPVDTDQGTGSFTVAGFVAFDGTAGSQRQNAMGRWTNVGGQGQFFVTNTQFSPKVWEFLISRDGTPPTFATVSAVDDGITETGVPTIERFLIAWYDGDLDTINIQSALGVVNTTGGVAVVFSGSTESLKFGNSFNSIDWLLRGGVWSWGYWKRVLTPEERNFLYKRNSGRLYAEFPEIGANGAASDDQQFSTIQQLLLAGRRR